MRLTGSLLVLYLLGLIPAPVLPSGPSQVRACRADGAAPQDEAARRNEFTVFVENPFERRREDLKKLSERALAFRARRNLRLRERIGQESQVELARARLAVAVKERESAEEEVKTYEEGIAAVDLANANSEIELAKSNLAHATERIAKVRSTLEKLRKLSTGSLQDEVALFEFEDRLEQAELWKQKAELELEQANSKLKVFLEYERPRHILELRSRLENAGEEEARRKKNLRFEEENLAGMMKPREIMMNSAPVRLLGEAFQEEAQIRAKLEELKTAPKDKLPGLREGSARMFKSFNEKIEEASRRLEEQEFEESRRSIAASVPKP
jgi:hypothetical protein